MTTSGDSNDSKAVTLVKIPDFMTGGVENIKHERYYHGYVPEIHTADILLDFGDFLVREAIKTSATPDPLYRAREKLVVSIRIAGTIYVQKEKEAWFKKWIEEGRDPAKLKEHGVREFEYMLMNDGEKAKYYTAESGIAHFPIKFSRRKNVFYMNGFGFERAAGLIDYHKRFHIPINADYPETVLQHSVRRLDWYFNHEQIDRLRNLGSGAFGEVFLGLFYLGSFKTRKVAVKQISGTVTPEENSQLFEEARMMQTFDHPNIVKLLGVAMNQDPIMIVMELAERGSVLDVIKREGAAAPSTAECIRYIYEAAKGLQYLKSQRIVHRDFAARNALLSKGGVVKISDFGLSIVGGEKKEKQLKKVPTRYLAPQTLSFGLYNYSTDVHSFGCFMYEVFHHGGVLYDGMTPPEVTKYVKEGWRLPCKTSNFPKFLWEILVRCWLASEKYRTTIEQVVAEIEQADRIINGHGFAPLRFVQRLLQGLWKHVEFEESDHFEHEWMARDQGQFKTEEKKYRKAMMDQKKKNKGKKKKAIASSDGQQKNKKN